MALPLPDELIGLAFGHLDVPSLLRCMQVCKLFHAIVLTSTKLCYKIELFASHVDDNENSSIDHTSRLSTLREHNRVWNDMDWPSSGTIPMCNGQCWEFSAGILAQSTHENGLFIVQLPCKLKGIPERRWTVPFDFRVRDFTLDSSQNLIVLLEIAGSSPDLSCKVHLRTFSGECHPNAAVAQIINPLQNVHPEFSFLIQICGNHVAILFYDRLGPSSHNFFVVWDWRTGHRKVYIGTPEFQTFAFMTEDLILAGILRSNTRPTLRVLSIAALAEPIYSLDDMHYICELQYPKLSANTEFFLIRSEPTPSWTPGNTDVPFYSSRKDFIFTISLRNSSGEDNGSTVLFVPLSTLLSEVERSKNTPRRDVAWSDWGPEQTRMLCREPSETWVCYAYGMKFVQGLRWRNGHQARVYDFNPYAARKHVKTSVDSPIPWKRLAPVSEPSSRCEIFDERVITKLPGRVATIALAHSDGGWDSVMIGQDHILMVQPASEEYGYMAM